MKKFIAVLGLIAVLTLQSCYSYTNCRSAQIEKTDIKTDNKLPA